MKRHITDEQIDSLLRSAVRDAGADDRLVDEIADSPALWWAIRRELPAEKYARSNGWVKWLVISFAAASALIILLSLAVIQTGRGKTEEQASVVVPAQQETVLTITGTGPSAEVVSPKAETPSKIVKKKVVAGTPKTSTRQAEAKRPKAAEIRSEFIALSYARDPESGQLVRVRVPSSMMVSLGLVSSVEKPNSMVDAEVLVGDDGLTRAIRFIHK